MYRVAETPGHLPQSDYSRGSRPPSGMWLLRVLVPWAHPSGGSSRARPQAVIHRWEGTCTSEKEKHLCLIQVRACVCSVAQCCLTPCDPMTCDPPGSSVHGESPGKKTGIGCHAFLQGLFPTQGSDLDLLCLLNWQADSLPLQEQSHLYWTLVSPGLPTFPNTVGNGSRVWSNTTDCQAILDTRAHYFMFYPVQRTQMT